MAAVVCHVAYATVSAEWRIVEQAGDP